MPSSASTQTKVVVATSVMLSFISFWRAAAIVLSDLASSAYYAGGVAENSIGKSAPWFILSIMLFGFAIRAIYTESCSMYVRGGVYKVVHEALGGTLAKFSVSALMFDYVLTGPISGVSAGLYLAGLINETSSYFHQPWQVPSAHFAAGFALLATLYFLAGEHDWHSRIERQSAAYCSDHEHHGGDPDRLVLVHGSHAWLPTGTPANAGQPSFRTGRVGLARRHGRSEHHADRPLDRTGAFAARHERF
jgi:hypothetical protein